MTTHWTKEYVTNLAPDASSLSAGEKLSKAKQWETLGQQEGVLWGTIKGSGKNPYQTIIALDTPSFKCSCPSRKFPCKHGLGLAFIFATDTKALNNIEMPEWVSDWVTKRVERAEKKAERLEKQNEPVDEATLKKREASQQKRLQNREEKVSAGVEELQRWLSDLIRQGLAQNDPNQWERMATRMVDAQAPGLARRLQWGANRVYQGEKWQEALLAEIARLHLLLQAWTKREVLPPELKDDVYASIGFTVNKEDLALQTGVPDQWVVLGQLIDEDGKLRMQRTYVYGLSTQRLALLLDYSVQGQAFPFYAPIGQVLKGEMVFYPSTAPLRAIFKPQDHSSTENTLPTIQFSSNITAFYAQLGTILAQQPWLETYPATLKQVRFLYEQEQWIVLDQDQHFIPVKMVEQQAWTLLSLSGGQPIDLVLEWQAVGYMQPLSAWHNQQLLWQFNLGAN